MSLHDRGIIDQVDGYFDDLAVSVNHGWLLASGVEELGDFTEHFHKRFLNRYAPRGVVACHLVPDGAALVSRMGPSYCSNVANTPVVAVLGRLYLNSDGCDKTVEGL